MDGSCSYDFFFDITQPVNDMLKANLDTKNKYIIYCSFLMDLMLLSFMLFFVLYWKLFRVIIAYAAFFLTRSFVQKTFYMGRTDGFLFGDPGMLSLCVPYHDTNDFFYSGHVGTCFILALEYRAMKWYRMFYFCCFIMVN